MYTSVQYNGISEFAKRKWKEFLCEITKLKNLQDGKKLGGEILTLIQAFMHKDFTLLFRKSKHKWSSFYFYLSWQLHLQDF